MKAKASWTVLKEVARVKPPSANVWDRFASSLSYVSGDPADPALYPSLERSLKAIEKDRPGPANFDIYCHEYPFEEYVAISSEIKSWREFGPYVAGVVSRFGEDSL